MYVHVSKLCLCKLDVEHFPANLSQRIFLINRPRDFLILQRNKFDFAHTYPFAEASDKRIGNKAERKAAVQISSPLRQKTKLFLFPFCWSISHGNVAAYTICETYYIIQCFRCPSQACDALLFRFSLFQNLFRRKFLRRSDKKVREKCFLITSLLHFATFVLTLLVSSRNTSIFKNFRQLMKMSILQMTKRNIVFFQNTCRRFVNYIYSWIYMYL